MLLDCRSSGAVDDAVVNFVSDDGATPLTLAMQSECSLFRCTLCVANVADCVR